MSFALDLKAFAEKFEANAELVTRKVILDVGKRLVEKSPVGDGDLWASPPPEGYVGGRFRANWQYAFNVVPTEALPDIDPTGQVSINRVAAASGEAGTHYLVNNLPYASRLEEGWSTQAPQGIVALTVIEFQGVVDRAVREAR